MKRLLVLLLALLPAPAASSAESPWVKEDGVAFRLISREDGVGDRSELIFALQVRLERGWKFFWRSPGKFGLRPNSDFARSTNLAEAELLWPTPRRLVLVKETGESAIGYDRETTLPVRVRPMRTNAPAELVLDLDYGVCGEVCTGGRVALALSLPAASRGPSKSAQTIESALAKVPARLPAEATTIRRDGSTLIVEIAAGTALSNPDLFVDAGPGRHYGAPKTTLAPDRRSALFRVPLDAADASADPSSLRLTLLSGNRAFEATAPVDR